MIHTNKIYFAYFSNDADNPLIEGSESKVRKFIKLNYKSDYKNGNVRIAYTFN